MRTNYFVFLLTFFAFLISLNFLARAEGASVSVSQKSFVVGITETYALNVTVTNKESQDDTFSISVFPASQGDLGISVEKYSLPVKAQKSESFQIFFTPFINAVPRAQIFTITAYSFTEKTSDSIDVTVIIVRSSPVYIESLSVNSTILDPGETLNFGTSVGNIANTPSAVFSLQSTITDENNNLIKTFSDNFSVGQKSSKTISSTFPLDKYFAPGIYKIETSLVNSSGETIQTESYSFKVSNLGSKLVTSETKNLSPFAYSFQITVKNEGNVPAENFYVNSSVPLGINTLFSSPSSPSSSRITGASVQYNWLVQKLDPGQEITISYQINIWTVWVGFLVLAGIVMVSFRFVFTPQLIKSTRFLGQITRDREIGVTIELRNNSLQELKEVMVRDFVPNTGSVIEKFQAIPPAVKPVGTGTELVWRIDSIKPREERIMFYKIKPTVQVLDSMRLPSASARFLNRKRDKKTVSSNEVLLRSR